MSRRSNARIGYLMILGASIGFGLIGPISRYPMQYGVSPLECAFWRALSGGIFFIAHGIVSKAWRIPAKQRALFSLFGIPGVGLLFFTYMFGVMHAGAATTAVLNNTAPVWVAVWSFLFFKEIMAGDKILGILLAIGGASLIAASGGGLAQGASATGIAAGLASGFLFSLHVLLGKKYLTTGISAVSLYMHILPVGALCLWPFVEFTTGKSLPVWAALIALGLFCNWLPYLFFCAGLKRLPATKASVFQTASEPLLAAFFAFVLWGEAFAPMGWTGAIMVIAAVVIVIRSKNTRPQAR